jgi:hypothetical protein
MEGPEPAQGQDWRPALLEDWLTIWHSELAAMVLDPELQEAKLRLLDTWAAQARLLLQTAARRGAADGAWPAPSGSAGPGAAAGAAAAVAAPDARDAELERLAARVFELERKLAGG